MAAEPAREWSDEQLNNDDLPKKDIIKFLQDNAAHSVCSHTESELEWLRVKNVACLKMAPQTVHEAECFGA